MCDAEVRLHDISPIIDFRDMSRPQQRGHLVWLSVILFCVVVLLWMMADTPLPLYTWQNERGMMLLVLRVGTVKQSKRSLLPFFLFSSFPNRRQSVSYTVYILVPGSWSLAPPSWKTASDDWSGSNVLSVMCLDYNMERISDSSTQSDTTTDKILCSLVQI